MPGTSHHYANDRGLIPVCAGIGLRAQHHAELLRTEPAVGWLEAHSENYLCLDSPAAQALLRLRERYPLSLHGVGLSLGSTDPLDCGHLEKLKRLIEFAEPALVSEHLAWGSVDGRFLNDLLPLPYTRESLTHMIERVDQTQNTLGRAILIENIAAYVRFAHEEMSEAQFLAELTHATGCGLLMDVNNLYVNERNHGLDARRFIETVPASAVKELHLAGHSVKRLGNVELLIDTHSGPVCDAVWALYEFAISRFAAVPTMIEWDSDLPSVAVLAGEADKARRLLERKHARAA